MRSPSCVYISDALTRYVTYSLRGAYVEEHCQSLSERTQKLTIYIALHFEAAILMVYHVHYRNEIHYTL